MEQFSLPDTFTELSVEEISGLIERARQEFNALNETDDLSDETLDEMTRLADAIDSLHEETQARAEIASTKRKGIFSKVFALTDGVELAKKKKALEKKVNKAFPGAAVPFTATVTAATPVEFTLTVEEDPTPAPSST